ncbi:MAG TPA: MFS transporter, partial [Actinomycetota bacterium]|nr:MFS transporter [Actinomycetota bacterium]
MRSLLRRRGFRDLLIGQTVSALGDWMATVALIVMVLDLTASSTAVGGMLVLRLLPAVIAGPITTRIVRRWNRRLTMLGADLARAGVVLLIPLVRGVWWIYLWAFLLEVGGLVFLPARDASIPDLAGDEDLPLANGLVLGTSYGTIPLGAAAFGGVAALEASAFGGAGFLGDRPFLLVFAIDAATFLVSFAFVRGLRTLDRPGERTPVECWPPTVSDGTRAGGRFIDAFRLPLVRVIFAPTLTVAMGVGTLFSVGIVFVREVLGASSTEFGALIVLFGLGAAAGLGIHRLLGWGPALGAVRLTVAAQGATVAVMGLAPALGFAYLGAGAFGLFTSATLVGGMSVLQSRLSGQAAVQAFAAFHVLIRAGLSLAAVAAGVAVDLAGGIRLPGLGRLEPPRLVLLSAGLLI